MRGKELAEIAKTTERSIRRYTKKAINDDLDYIEVADEKYLFKVVIDKEARGKVYEYTLKEKSEVEEVDISVNIGRKFLMADDASKAEALLKCRLVEEYLRRDEEQSMSKFLKELNHIYDDLEVNPQKLYRWKALYENARELELNPAEFLLDKRGSNTHSKLDDEMKAMAIRMTTSRKRTRSGMAIYKDMQHHFGDKLPSYDTVLRFCEKWKRENPLTYEFSQNPDAAKSKYMMSAGSYSEGVKARNQVWELDSTPADIITSDGKRMAVLASLDVHTRRATIHLDERSSSYSIARLLRKSIKRFGVPEMVVTDNGKDYTSNHFAAICQTLGIYQKIVPPFSGDAKPHVERFFRTLSSDLFEGLDGYIGHNVAERAALTAQKSFEDKQASMEQFRKASKKGFTEKWKFKKENLGIELKITMTAKELEVWVDRWNARIYEQRAHAGLGKRKPIDVWNNCSFPVKAIADPRMLDILTGEHFKRRVGKEGIRIDNAHYIHEKLIPYAGEHVLIITPEDYGHIFVFSLDYMPICIAEDVEKTGKSRVHLKHIKAKSKAHMRKLNKMLKEWEEFDEIDPNIKTRIEEAVGVIKAKTTAETKHTPQIDAILEGAKAFAKDDKEEIKESHTYNLKGERLLPSGRPQFAGPYERLLWELENDKFNEKSQRIADKYPDLYELAKTECERRKKAS